MKLIETKKQNSSSRVSKIIRQLPEDERNKFFDSFNKIFQLEFMIMELAFVKSEKLFKYVYLTNELIKKLFISEYKCSNYPRLGIELLINADLNWKKISNLESKYEIKVTSIHSPLSHIHDSIWGKITRHIFKKELRGKLEDNAIKKILKGASIPLTVHASQMESFKNSDLHKKIPFRIENDSVSREFGFENMSKFCSLEETLDTANCHRAGYVFDTYHYFTFVKYCEKSSNGEDKIGGLSCIINKNFLLGDKFHLSEGKNEGKRLTDRHISLNNKKGEIGTCEFLRKYNFYRYPRNYLTLELNPLEKGARMIPKRVIEYYADNYMIVIECLIENLIKHKYEK